MANQLILSALVPQNDSGTSNNLTTDYFDGEIIYSGISCNRSSTCYGGVYQGEYTVTELLIIIFMLGLWIYSILLTRKAYGILNADT